MLGEAVYGHAVLCVAERDRRGHLAGGRDTPYGRPVPSDSAEPADSRRVRTGTTARSHNTVAQGQRAMQTQTHIVIQIKVEKRINIC